MMMICEFYNPIIWYRNVDCSAYMVFLFFCLSEAPSTCFLQDGSTLSILMEYVHGGSLRKFISVYGSLTESLTAIYTEKILEGLAYLHKRQYYDPYYLTIAYFEHTLSHDFYGLERCTASILRPLKKKIFTLICMHHFYPSLHS